MRIFFFSYMKWWKRSSFIVSNYMQFHSKSNMTNTKDIWWYMFLYQYYSPLSQKILVQYISYNTCTIITHSFFFQIILSFNMLILLVTSVTQKIWPIVVVYYCCAWSAFQPNRRYSTVVCNQERVMIVHVHNMKGFHPH